MRAVSAQVGCDPVLRFAVFISVSIFFITFNLKKNYCIKMLLISVAEFRAPLKWSI